MLKDDYYAISFFFFFQVFTEMPCEHYLIVAQLLLSSAPEDIPNAQQIKTLVKVSIYYCTFVFCISSLVKLRSCFHKEPQNIKAEDIHSSVHCIHSFRGYDF